MIEADRVTETGESTETADTTETTDTAETIDTGEVSGSAATGGDRPTLPLLLGGIAVLGVVLAVVFGVLWRSASGDLASIEAQERDRQTAVDTAADYAARSLTYDYRNLEDFFAGVDEGASQALQDRYDGVREALTAIMTESEVVATGEVLSAALDSESDGDYTVSVFAEQTTQNVQQPDAGAVPNLLTVTVTEQDGRWIVTDYGPA